MGLVFWWNRITHYKMIVSMSEKHNIDFKCISHFQSDLDSWRSDSRFRTYCYRAMFTNPTAPDWIQTNWKWKFTSR